MDLRLERAAEIEAGRHGSGRVEGQHDQRKRRVGAQRCSDRLSQFRLKARRLNPASDLEDEPPSGGHRAAQSQQIRPPAQRTGLEHA